MSPDSMAREIGALRRVAHHRLPSPRVAKKRASIKRRLRRSGLAFDPNLTTAELVALMTRTR